MQRVCQPRRWQLFVELKEERDHHDEVDRRDLRGPARQIQAFWILAESVSTGSMYALLPRWVGRRGALESCILLFRRRGRALDNWAWVEDRLGRLRSPAESDVPSVIQSKAARGHGKLLEKFVDGCLTWGWRFRFHLLGVIESHGELSLEDLALITLRCWDLHLLDADDSFVRNHLLLL